MNKHLLSINDLSAEEAFGILNTASELAKISDAQFIGVEKAPFPYLVALARKYFFKKKKY